MVRAVTVTAEYIMRIQTSVAIIDPAWSPEFIQIPAWGKVENDGKRNTELELLSIVVLESIGTRLCFFCTYDGIDACRMVYDSAAQQDLPLR